MDDQRMEGQMGAGDRRQRGNRQSAGRRTRERWSESGVNSTKARTVGIARTGTSREVQGSSRNYCGGFDASASARRNFSIYASQGIGDQLVGEQRGIRTIWRISYHSARTTVGNVAGQLQCCSPSDAVVFAADGGAAARRCADRRVDGGVSGCSVHFDLRGYQGV